MTKYVLNSGGINNQPTRKRNFHRELVIGLGSSPKFLICSFAIPREYWETKFPGYCSSISTDLTEDTSPAYDLAMPATFVEQCKEADVIYFNGGDDHLLQYWLKQYNLTEVFDGKVVATNSASSDTLAAHYWACDWRECGDGLGILPVKFIAHYNSVFGDDDPRGPVDWEAGYKALAEFGDTSLPVVALEEGEYRIFTV